MMPEALFILMAIELALIFIFFTACLVAFGPATEITFGPMFGPKLWTIPDAWHPAYIHHRYVRIPLLPGIILVGAVNENEFDAMTPRPLQ